MRPLGWLTRITHAGVDPGLPRYATKHIVLANQYALYAILSLGLSSVAPTARTLLPEVRVWILAGIGVGVVTLALNASRRPLLASGWLVTSLSVIFVGIGRLEPPETEHAGFIIMNAVVGWFVFPPTRRVLAYLATLVSAVGVGVLFWCLDHLPPPPQLPGFDVVTIARGNLVMLFIVLIFFCVRTVGEMARVERELVEERKKTESLLKREVAHQVAERSRELGAALTRGAITAASFASPYPFGERYRVVCPLGEGGMGAVFEVERLTDGQHVALKVMTGDVSREQATRFAREAEIGARVHDAHLVSITDVGVAEGGAPFLVMELVTGGSVEQQRARFGDAAWALPILRDVAHALSALHSAGVVHRDLKPGNVLLDRSGAAKVSDFGIARLGTPLPALPSLIDVEAATQQPGSGALTGTGALLGTPLYMAPESARGGRELGPKADIFAFGVLAHEMLTGRTVYATPPVLLALASQPLPEPPALDTALPAKMREALRACLSEEPSKRPDAVRLVLALDE